MKTTVELPDALLRRAKIAAAQMDTTLKDIMTRALERELAGLSSEQARAAQPIHVIDEDGLPCLPRRGAVVTDPLVNQLREEQGI
jgi:hypothetical protein